MASPTGRSQMLSQASFSAMSRIFMIILTLVGVQLSVTTFAGDQEQAAKTPTGKLPMLLESLEKQNTQVPSIKNSKAPSISEALKDHKPEAEGSKLFFARFRSILNILNEYASLIAAFAAVFTAFVALYLGDWRARLRKPKLRLFFSEKKEYPYFHKLAFEGYSQPIDFVGQTIYLLKPGFNSRVKVYNKGKSSAKGVQTKVERIVLKDKNSGTSSERFYHPTTVKWSGERDWNAVDIVPESHFFLDLFWSKNEKSSEVTKFNNIKYREEIDKGILQDIVENDICPSGEVYWNVWTDISYDRGIPVKYDFQGEITIYFIVNGENCEPLRFEALIDWSYDNWDCPNIKIRQGKRFINND